MTGPVDPIIVSPWQKSLVALYYIPTDRLWLDRLACARIRRIYTAACVFLLSRR